MAERAIKDRQAIGVLQAQMTNMQTALHAMHSEDAGLRALNA